MRARRPSSVPGLCLLCYLLLSRFSQLFAGVEEELCGEMDRFVMSATLTRYGNQGVRLKVGFGSSRETFSFFEAWKFGRGTL